MSVGVRGPVSVRQAVSVSPVEVMSMQITKSVNGEDADALCLLIIDFLNYLLCEDDILCGRCEDRMHDIDLTRINTGLSIEAHVMNRLNILTEALHIIEVRPYGIEALYASGTCSDDHLLTGTHELNAGTGDVCLQILCVVTTRKCDTDHTV